MTLIQSRIKPSSESFRQNQAHTLALCESLREQKELLQRGGGEQDGAGGGPEQALERGAQVEAIFPEEATRTDAQCPGDPDDRAEQEGTKGKAKTMSQEGPTHTEGAIFSVCAK